MEIIFVFPLIFSAWLLGFEPSPLWKQSGGLFPKCAAFTPQPHFSPLQSKKKRGWRASDYDKKKLPKKLLALSPPRCAGGPVVVCQLHPNNTTLASGLQVSKMPVLIQIKKPPGQRLSYSSIRKIKMKCSYYTSVFTIITYSH